MAGQFRQQRQWTLPGGTAASADRYQGLSGGAPSFADQRSAAAGWAIWNRGCHQRSGRLPVRHARQRLHCVGSGVGAEPPAPACRPAVQPFGKWSGAAALRLSRCSCGARGRALPCRGGHPSGGLEKEPHRSHPPGRGLRTLFHPSAARRVHCLRCGGTRATHRGAFEPLLADLRPGARPRPLVFACARLSKKRGRSSRNGSPNLRLELGHVLEPTPMRTTEFAPPVTEITAEQAPVQGYGKQITRPALESGPFLRARLRPPARWDAALSGWQDVAPNRAAKLCRWQSARALQRQHPRLSWLPKAFAVSVARGSNHEAASDQCEARILSGLVPRRCGFARLEPERAPARLYAARATPTYRGESAVSRRSFALPRGRDPFSRAACPLSPLVGRAARSQCACSNGWPGHDQALRHPRKLCRLARFGDSLTQPGLPRCSFSSDRFASPSGASWPFFLAFPRCSSSSALFALHPSGSAISHGLNVRF